jgi:hypothetical protein
LEKAEPKSTKKKTSLYTTRKSAAAAFNNKTSVRNAQPLVAQQTKVGGEKRN